MHKIEEYENHAAACRQMASKRANPARREQLLQTAETWERLARERRIQLSEQSHDGHIADRLRDELAELNRPS